jgi:MFS family permease
VDAKALAEVEGISLGGSMAAPPLHRNISLSLAFTFLLYTSRGIWQSTILPLYIGELAGGGKAPIGYMQAAQGIATLLTAAPAGWAADGLGRARVLRVAAVCGLLAVALTLIAVYLSSLTVLGCALALWGVFSGAQTPAMGALIADSAGGGSLARLYVLRQIALQLATAIGPAVAVVVFGVRTAMGAPGGEEGWDLGTCAAIIGAGAAMHLLSGFGARRPRLAAHCRGLAPAHPRRGADGAGG